ncbi:MAG: cyclic nucleotide-binding domain-containing protein [Desulfobacteraceae bacterium]|nr:cyclic nucleotide-binding domain-containing protein [Desulfobacteraceae bacterium]
MQEISKEHKKDTTHALEVKVCKSGDIILKEGQINPFFYVVLSGQVRLSREGVKIRVLDEQDIFGLESLVLRRPSYYTALAMQACRIATYGPEALDHLIRESPRMVQNLLISTLHQLKQTTNVLLDISDTIIMDDKRLAFYKDGDIVFDQNSRGTEIYRLISTQGGLQVTILGNEIVRLTKPGEFFGLPDLPKQTVVKSMGESVVEVYRPEDLDIIIRNHPEAARHIMHTLLQHVHSKEDKPAD